jgi:membrane protease YdiL (CAAX protease family)
MGEGMPVIPEAEPAAAEKRIWGPWATLGLGAVVLCVFFAVAVFIVFVVAVVLALARPEAVTSVEALMDLITAKMGLVVAVASIGAYSVGMALILAVIKVRKGKGIADYLGLKKIGWQAVLIVLLVTGAYLALMIVIANMAKIKEEDTGLLVRLYDTSVWPALLWIAVVVFAPVFEEPLARGFLFEGFRRSRLGLAGAILLTSLIWTSLHIGYSLFSLWAIFGFGIVLGFVRYRTGSLWSTMLMHAFYNAVGMSLVAFGQV